MNAVWLIIILTAVVALLCIFIYRWSKPRGISAVITVLIGGSCALLVYYYMKQHGLTMWGTVAIVAAVVLLVLIWLFLRKALLLREIVKYQKRVEAQPPEPHDLLNLDKKSPRHDIDRSNHTDGNTGRPGC